MTDPTHPQVIEFIPIDRIDVLNPRTRSRRQHNEIVDNIEAVGLKRPVTVRRHPDDPERYDLICGEGRLEAFRLLGQTNIPAVVVDVAETDGMLMSLVENIARRKHRPIDLMMEIGSLHDRGYADGVIAEKIGCTQTWVNMIVTLFERGEERLVAAVESGVMPINVAISISRAKSDEVQSVLMEAYETGQIKGKKLAQVRRIVEQRERQRKAVPDAGFARRGGNRTLTTADLMRLCQREADKHRLLVKRAEVTQSRLTFIVEALRDMLADPEFARVMRGEGLTDMPKAITDRLTKEGAR